MVTLVVVTATSDSQLAVYDSSGNLLHQVEFPNSTQVLSISQMAQPEDPHFTVLTSDKQLINYKIVIKEDFQGRNSSQSTHQ